MTDEERQEIRDARMCLALNYKYRGVRDRALFVLTKCLEYPQAMGEGYAVVLRPFGGAS